MIYCIFIYFGFKINTTPFERLCLVRDLPLIQSEVGLNVINRLFIWICDLSRGSWHRIVAINLNSDPYTFVRLTFHSRQTKEIGGTGDGVRGSRRSN